MLDSLRVKIFADGADPVSMAGLAEKPWIKGFTTNPTLMAHAGVTDYAAFARAMLQAIPDRPVSFEVVADDFAGMEQEARTIASWGDHVYVKIPVTTTKREPTAPLIRRLSESGVQVNVTAVMTEMQVRAATAALKDGAPSIVSVFAGRIADTGINPVLCMVDALQTLRTAPRAELLWASAREVLNVMQADGIGCHIITLPPALLAKLPMLGRDLKDVSFETVQMFHDDATRAGLAVA